MGTGGGLVRKKASYLARSCLTRELMHLSTSSAGASTPTVFLDCIELPRYSLRLVQAAIAVPLVGTESWQKKNWPILLSSEASTYGETPAVLMWPHVSG